MALNAYAKVGVSLYDTLGNEAVGMFSLILVTANLGANQTLPRIYVRFLSTLMPSVI